MTAPDAATAVRLPAPGYLHELLLSSSVDELLDGVVPFVVDGRAAGEPTLLCLRPRTTSAVLDAVGTSSGVSVLAIDPDRRRPGADLLNFRTLAQTAQDQAGYVRVVNELPQAAYDDWYQWRRYEAAANVALADVEVRGLCVYDRERMHGAMADDLFATHPYVRTGAAMRRTDRYEDPVEFGAAHFDAAPDPVERTRPDVTLVDAYPGAVRTAVRAIADHHPQVTQAEVEALVLGVNEAVTNAALHGRPPVRVLLWAPPDRVVVTVTDAGPGPADCFVGVMPSQAGDGMWLSHQIVDVAHRRHDGGYTVRLSAGSVGSAA